MRRVPATVSTVIVGSVLLCSAGAAQALGFGRVVNASFLGQPLNFAAAIRLEGDETLPRECVSAEVLPGETRLPTAALRVTVEPGADPSERLVRVTTQVPIEEPVVTVTVTAGCVPRLTRSFVMLMDPPGINLAQTAAPAPNLPPQQVESQVSPVLAAAQAGEAASAASAPRPAAPRQDDAAPVRPRLVPPLAAAPASRPAAQTARARDQRIAAARAAPARRTGGPRLKLEPASALPVAAAASAPAGEAPNRASPVLAAASAAAPADAASAAPVVEAAASAAAAAQQRVAALEESMERLREETQATQKAIATLQASIKEAESARYANPLVYGLALLSALLALGVAALWWRQSHVRPGSQWWLAPAGGPIQAQPPVRRVPPRRPGGLDSVPRVETQPAVMDDRAVERVLDDVPLGRSVPLQAAVPPVATAPPVVVADPPLLRRELSVEELIDLEQQADFFVVLGQDEAAIDLLMGHVRSSGGVSPLPYLKLLEIYRRRGEREAYERIRERFNRRFSAYAPDWDSDLQQGQSIDNYPKMLIQLQRLWDEPTRLTEMLDSALMRQDGRGEIFDLPAYRELLFLYSIARDLAEHPAATTPVDLLLPLEGEVQEKPIEQLTASRLMGFAQTHQQNPPVDFDLTRPMPGNDPRNGPSSDFLGLIDPRLKDDDAPGRR